jgi:uncharacterized repeat protein (TIGR01451 family)
VATQAVNVARVRADQQQTWIDSNPVTNRIDATEGVALLKTSSTTNLLVPGTGVVYTIQIANTGTIWQTGIRLEDLLPFGMTYSNASAELIRTFPHTNTFLDVFNARAYTNSDGNVAWAGPWTESGRRRRPDQRQRPDPGGRRVHSGPDLCACGRCPPRRSSARRISAAIHRRAFIRLSAHRAGGRRIRQRQRVRQQRRRVHPDRPDRRGHERRLLLHGFLRHLGLCLDRHGDPASRAARGATPRPTSSGWTTSASHASAASATNALGPPPALLDGYTLPPGTNMTVRLTATVDDPLVATTFINTARLISDQQTTWITSRVTNAASGSIGMKVVQMEQRWRATGTTGDQRLLLTIENTGTVDVDGHPPDGCLPSGVTYVPGSAAMVDLLWVTTNAFVESVSDGFGTAAYDNNDGTTNWLGNWAEVGDGTPGLPTAGNVLIRVAGGTNALVFENTNADNDFVTRTNPLAWSAGADLYQRDAEPRLSPPGMGQHRFHDLLSISTNGFAEPIQSYLHGAHLAAGQ